MNKKDMKLQVKQDLKDARAAARQHKKELSQLSVEDKKLSQQKAKQEAVLAKKARKEQIKQMPKEERKSARLYDCLYKKRKRMPIKITVWACVLVLLAYGIFLLSPAIKSINSIGAAKFNTDTPEAIAAREYGMEVSRLISQEGIVLLKNENNVLPLENTHVNVFSIAAYNIRYGGGGSGMADQSEAVDLFEGLQNAGISYNKELNDFYLKRKDTKGIGNQTGIVQVIAARLKSGNAFDEPDISYLTQEVIDQAKRYSDTAIVVFASDGVEASDFTASQLRLSQNKRDLLAKLSSEFSNIIVIINAGNTMELGFIDEYENIKAAIWLGTPGVYGCDSLGKVLKGDLNPSGRLTDTFAYDVTSHPASVNFGNYKYENIPGMAFINYNEGIYVGYRYFETRYKDNEKAYERAVQYPFGYGLSYTDFEWSVLDFLATEEKIQYKVEVKNTGAYAGKDVVQLYYSAPYYNGGIEKSAIELAAYAKTKLLAPGASEVLDISFDTRDMASYDMAIRQAYVLESGSYNIKLARNVHDIVHTQEYVLNNTIVYTKGIEGGAESSNIRNRFQYGDGGLLYLSRLDWDKTYPDNSNLSHVASKELLAAHKAKIAPSTAALPQTGVNKDILLKDLRGLAYDDPKWDDYLGQFTIEEMKGLFLEGAYKTNAVERLGLPSSVLLDGPAGINSMFSKVTAASYPTEVVIASTWNDELAYLMGEAVGKEANAYGVHGWYAPGMNLHRTPQGGRNFEYFSEDPLLSGKMSAAMVKGAQSRNILVFMKHFALNDQEENARSGIFVWANEQAIRELYLRPFEITVKEGGVTGAMTSFVHIGHIWCGGNPELLEGVLRGEWGFTGVVTTDAVLGGFMDANLAVRYGNDLMLDIAQIGNKKYMNKLYKEDPAAITTALQQRTHNICYALLNYTDLVK